MKRDLSVRELFDGYAMEFDSIYGAERRSWWQKRLDRWFRQSMVRRLAKTLEACEPIAGKRETYWSIKAKNALTMLWRWA